MAADSKPALLSTGHAPVNDKEVDLTGSASGSEIETHTTRKGYRDGVTFASRGLRQDNYKPVDSYEGLHRYDPDFEWEPEEERKVVRKVQTSNGAQQQKLTNTSRSTSVSAPGYA
jgi:hypothetical protein